MDASQYKDYVLFLLFIKYVSDKYGNSEDFAPPVNIPAGAGFTDMVALKGASDIGDKINTHQARSAASSRRSSASGRTLPSAPPRPMTRRVAVGDTRRDQDAGGRRRGQKTTPHGVLAAARGHAYQYSAMT
jgi:hypothetical protein